MANVSKIQLPNGDIYALEDSAAQSALSSKQDKLVSGTNIKTVNGVSLLGSGDVPVSGGVTSYNDLTNKPTIEGITLQGDNTYETLGLEHLTNQELEEMLI